VHVHVFDDDGRQTLAAGPAARVLQAVRASCPGVPISSSTSADIEPDPAIRFRAVASWTELPDLVTANQGEVGIVELCGLLASCVGFLRVEVLASRPVCSHSTTRRHSLLQTWRLLAACVSWSSRSTPIQLSRLRTRQRSSGSSPARESRSSKCTMATTLRPGRSTVERYPSATAFAPGWKTRLSCRMAGKHSTMLTSLLQRWPCSAAEPLNVHIWYAQSG